MTESILQEAERIINGDRAEQYGNACDSLERIASMWNSYIFATYEGPQPLGPVDVANMMVLLKVSRSKTSLDRYEFHRDSHVDMAGYAGLGGKAWDEIQESLKTKAEPRVWQSLTEVPDGVRVRGKDDDPGIEWYPDDTTLYDEYGPFTEVIDD